MTASLAGLPVAREATRAVVGSTSHLRACEAANVSLAAQNALADAYASLPALSRDPVTLAAWRAFGTETMAQWRALSGLGWRMHVTDEDPYSDASELFAELPSRNIRVLASSVTGGHPLLSDAVNDTFRAVHDILGHAATGGAFDRIGEETAFRAHWHAYSPLARLALTTETRGQSAYVFTRGTFDIQRCAILPRRFRSLDSLD